MSEEILGLTPAKRSESAGTTGLSTIQGLRAELGQVMRLPLYVVVS